jgi:8-oxo-dGTP diphosphatase
MPYIGNCLTFSTSTERAVLTDRNYPARPILAVSAAIVRDGRVLIVRRAPKPPAGGLYTLPGGVVEVGETLAEAVVREVQEETALTIEPMALAGYLDAIAKDGDGRIRRHFVILPFAARWIAGEPVLNEELTEALWLEPAAVTGLKTTDGLAGIVESAVAIVKSHKS